MMAWLLDSLHKSEWLTVYILSLQALLFLVQALIFVWQSRILRHHGDLMKRQTEISEKQAATAEKQATTAELIGKALDQQGKVLADQAKISADQLEFQKNLQANEERKVLWELMTQLTSKARYLQKIIEVARSNPLEVSKARLEMRSARSTAQKAIVNCVHLNREEWLYMSGYLKQVSALKETGDLTEELNQLSELNEKYKDFGSRIITHRGEKGFLT